MSNLINLVMKRSMSSASVINHVTIVGGGLMGAGISQVKDYKLKFKVQSPLAK
jgi:hypothetical protein